MLREFYDAVLPAEGYYCVTLLPEGRHLWAESIDELVELTERYDARTGVYFGTAAFSSVANRKQTNVLSLRALRLDIDAGDKKYAKDPDGTYPSQRDALAAFVAFTRSSGLQFSYLLSSGMGLHVYYCLDEALPPDTWLPLAEGLGQLAATHGLKVDSSVTADSARILRPVGGLHSGTTRVSILKQSGMVHTEATLLAKIPIAAIAIPTRKYDCSINDELDMSFQGPPSSALKIAEHCAVLAEIAAVRGNVPEPKWRAMLGLVKRTVEGIEIAQKWSSGHPGYNPVNVERKFDAWATGPTTCSEFSKYSDKCGGCKHRGTIKSPISLGLMTTPEIEQLPEGVQTLLQPAEPQETSGAPWDGCIPAGFEVTTTKAGKQVLVYNLLIEKESETGEMVPTIVKVPFTYNIFWFGQWAEADTSDDTAQVALHLWTGTYVKRYLMDQTVIATPFKLLEYMSSKAIHTTTHKKAAQAMQDYSKAQLQHVHSARKNPKITDHLGLRFIETGELICAHGRYAIYPDGAIREAMLGAALREVGSQFTLPLPKNGAESWDAGVWDSHIIPRAQKHVEFLTKYYGKPDMEKFQLAIMLGLASPLMAFVTGEFYEGSALPKMSSLSVSLFSRETARGKTSACASSVLAYGRPSDLVNDSGKTGTTENGRISRLSAHGTMPSVMDEMGGATATSVAGLVSAVSNGAAKGRAKQDGSMRSGIPWSLVNLITTNKSQRDMIAAVDDTTGAVQYRLLEINFDHSPEFDQETRDRYVNDWGDMMRNCVGALGAVIHREICALGKDKVNKLVTDCVAKAGALVKADQSARFQYRGLGALLALHLLLARLKLAPFALPGLVSAFKEAHDAGKDFVKENVLTTDGIELLSRALLDLAPHTIVTDDETHRARNTTRFDLPLNTRMPDVVHARHIRSLARSYVSVQALRKWCSDKGVSERDIITSAKEQNVLILPDRSVAGEKVDRAYGRKVLTKGLKDTMELVCPAYTFDVRRLYMLQGEGSQESLDEHLSNVIELRPSSPDQGQSDAEVTPDEVVAAT